MAGWDADEQEAVLKDYLSEGTHHSPFCPWK